MTVRAGPVARRRRRRHHLGQGARRAARSCRSPSSCSAGAGLAPIVAGAPRRSPSTWCCGSRGGRRRVGAVLRVPPRGGRRPHDRAPTSARSSAPWATAICLLVVGGRGHLGALCSVGARYRRRRGATRPRPTRCCWRGSAGTLLVLLTENPMWRPHVVAARPRARPPRRPPPAADEGARRRRAGRPPVPPRPRLADAPPRSGYRGQHRAGGRGAARSCPTVPSPSATIPASCGGRAGARPPDLVDASILRIETGDITGASVAAVAAEPDVCAVVVRSAARWGSFDDLPDRLADLGYEIGIDADPLPPRVRRTRPSLARRRLSSDTASRSRLKRSTAVVSGRRPRRSRWRRPGVASMTLVNDTRSEARLSTTSATSTTVRTGRLVSSTTAEPEHRAEQVGAGVAQHQPLAEVGREQPGGRAHHRGQRQAHRRRAGRQRDRDVGEQADLDRAARGPVEQVAEVGGEGDQRGVGQQPPAAHLARRRREDDGDDAAAEQLHGAGGEPAVAQGPQVPAEATVARRCRARSSMRPRKAKAKQAKSTIERRRLSLSSSPTPNSARAVRAGLDHQHGQHDHQAAGGGQLVAAVVRAAQGRRAQDGADARSSSSGGDHAARRAGARRRAHRRSWLATSGPARRGRRGRRSPGTTTASMAAGHGDPRVVGAVAEHGQRGEARQRPPERRERGAPTVDAAGHGPARRRARRAMASGPNM